MNERTKTLENACKDFEEDLVLYYYGDDSEADHARIENHLTQCALCRAFIADLRKLLPQMARSSEMPPSFWDNYHREMVEKLARQSERGRWWQDLFAPIRVWMLPAFGTVAVAVLAIGIVFGNGVWTSQPTQPLVPQEILSDVNQLEFFNSLDMLESLPKLEASDGTQAEPQVGGGSI